MLQDALGEKRAKLWINGVEQTLSGYGMRFPLLPIGHPLRRKKSSKEAR